MLKPGKFIESKVTEIIMDSMAPPDTIRVKGQWKEAKALKSNNFTTNFDQVEPDYFLTAPVPIDMSVFDKPNFAPFKGVNRAISLPSGMSAQGSFEGSGKHYLNLLNHKHGLNNNWISSLMQDRRGRVWIGTYDGIGIWDGATLSNLTYQEGFPSGNVSDMLEDSNGNIWMVISGFGLIVWNGDVFTAYTKKEGLSDNNVTSLLEDDSGMIWIGTQNGLNMWDGDRICHYFIEQGLTHDHITDLAQDQHGDIWIGTKGGGISIWDGAAFSRFTTKDGISGDNIYSVLADSKGNVWVSSQTTGINKWDGKGLTYFTGQQMPTDDFYHAFKMIEDSKGNIWIAANIGVYVYDGKTFTLRARDGLKFSAAFSLMEDTSGQIWIGTTGGGLHVMTQPNDKHYASDELIWYFSGYVDLLKDSDGNMWVLSEKLKMMSDFDTDNIESYNLQSRTYNPDVKLFQDKKGDLFIGSIGLKVIDLDRFNEKLPKYLHYEFDTAVSTELIEIKPILEDQNQNLWMGTNRENGLLFWDRSVDLATDSITFIQYSIDQGLQSSWISSLLEDRQGRIWIGSGAGISVLDGGRFTQFSEVGLTGVMDMTIDHEGKIWIVTNSSGVYVWNGDGFTWYTEQEGLPTNSLSSIYIDKNENIWIGTKEGLIELRKGDDGHIYFKNFNEYRGIDRSSIFKVLLDNENRLWAISKWNMDIIDLESQTPDTTKPKLSLYQVQPFFDQFDWRMARQSISDGEIIVTGEKNIPLANIKYDSVYSFTNTPVDPHFPYNINHLTFEWSSTYWADPTSLKYSYILEGSDPSWSPLIKENSVTYNDLRPGDYTLKVRAVGGNGQWSDTSSYSFAVMPPIWATWWAYWLYGLCTLGLVFALHNYEKKRFILRQKAKSLEEIDKTKTEFFTNISHELRTPLTLILGPLKAIQEKTYTGDRESLFTMMSQNGRRLLQLVNQLLDLSKLDQGKLQLQPEYCLINELVLSVVANFDSAAAANNINLDCSGASNPLPLVIDQEKIKQVLFNLLGNAIKFTPEGGTIKVLVSATDGAVKIEVRDSGIGIPKDELGNIFNRFYQVNYSGKKESEGTGIGLALTQKLVHLHNGTIEVTSEPDWGTTFTVLLPVITPEENASIYAGKESDTGHFDEPIHETEVSEVTETVATNYPLLLIVEDNVQMRQFIKTCLGNNYHYLEATHGTEGVRLADSRLPDLILSDVMMPEMDGYEFCQQVRENETTTHIPFIFLTAKADLDSRLQGLELGSSDYVAKPFEAEELRLKVRNHLDKMQQYRSFFTRQMAIKGEIEAVESLDDVFLNKAIEVVQGQMDNHEFTVNNFAQEIGMSKTQLYRKLITLTGQSPTGFVRCIRLKKAGQLIMQNHGTISEIAYTVGFNNMSYFTKCFKEQFGAAPSRYRKKKRING